MNIVGNTIRNKPLSAKFITFIFLTNKTAYKKEPSDVTGTGSTKDPGIFEKLPKRNMIC